VVGVAGAVAALDLGEDLAAALGEGPDHVLGDASDADEAAGVGVDLVAEGLEVAGQLGVVDGGSTRRGSNHI
jgi:hypothetical protein